MRPALRLLATATRGPVETGAPTGLTGLFTHPTPRSTLLYLYSSTLDKLRSHFPESSVYRQSTEALTRHRMTIIEAAKPAGLTEWQERVKQVVDAHPEAFRRVPIATPSGGTEFNIVWRPSALKGMETEEWGDEYVGKPQLEGPRSLEERENQREILERDPVEEHSRIPRIEPEPPLSLQQIEEVESKIGAGLIEEVIQVAEGEKDLVNVMAENKVYVSCDEHLL
jgi:NADH dehydrogenase (ubiquinone) 1 alpha subcomplex subunit 5